MTKNTLILSTLAVFILAACQNKQTVSTPNTPLAFTTLEETAPATEQLPVPQRAPAYATFTQDNTDKHIKTYQAIMNAKNDKDRLDEFYNFIKRQVNFYYIAHEYLRHFDLELDNLYQKKLNQNQLTAEDKLDFQKIRFQNIVSWEFSERNLNEVLELYNLVLINAHDDASPYQRGSKWILAKIPVWLRAASKNGDQLALMTLTEHLNEVNHEFKRKSKKVNLNLFPDFTPFFKLTNEQIDEASKKSDEIFQNHKKNGFDSFLEKKWTEYLKQRESSEDATIWFDGDRTPQALDILQPDPGSKGQVTGNRFPSGKWAMTFDDGPHATHTPGMFDNLKSTGTHGTFFWLAQSIAKYPTLVKQAKDLGLSRGLHSYTHANLSKLNQVGLDKEINQASDVFTKVIGERPTLFRCPYGDCGPSGSSIRQMIANRKMLHILWNVDTLDWQDTNPDSIFERTKKQIDILGRGIVLFHDIHSQSVIASKKVILYLKTKYKIESLNKLIEESRGSAYYTP